MTHTPLNVPLLCLLLSAPLTLLADDHGGKDPTESAGRDADAPLAEYTADNENWDDDIGVNWERMRHKAREHWQEFSEAELSAVQGRREDLIDRVAGKYGLARDDAEREVDSWARDVSMP